MFWRRRMSGAVPGTCRLAAFNGLGGARVSGHGEISSRTKRFIRLSWGSRVALQVIPSPSRGRSGSGWVVRCEPIPLPASPLKGEQTNVATRAMTVRPPPQQSEGPTKICARIADAASSILSSGEHCRGAWAKGYDGIQKSPLDRSRFLVRTGHTGPVGTTASTGLGFRRKCVARAER